MARPLLELLGLFEFAFRLPIEFLMSFFIQDKVLFKKRKGKIIVYVIGDLLAGEDHCQMEPEVISSCQYDSSCQCRGQLPSGTLSAPFPATYGSQCQPWDSVACKETWSNQPNATWNSSGDNAPRKNDR